MLKNSFIKLYCFIIIILISFNYNLNSEEMCSEKRKQWIEFFKKDFANNFSKIEYTDDPCIVSAISFEIKDGNGSTFIDVGDNNGHFQKLSTEADINWVPEYFELDAKPDYLYSAQYFYKKSYGEAALFLSDFLENHSKDKLAPKGQFLYAETFRFREDYIEAATQYLTGYEKFIESEFTALNVMRLGEMMIKIDYPKTGCELLNNVQNEVPPVNDDIYLETEQLMKIYECPKIVTTDGEIMLANLIKDAKELIQ